MKVSYSARHESVNKISSISTVLLCSFVAFSSTFYTLILIWDPVLRQNIGLLSPTTQSFLLFHNRDSKHETFPYFTYSSSISQGITRSQRLFDLFCKISLGIISSTISTIRFIYRHLFVVICFNLHWLYLQSHANICTPGDSSLP